MDSRQVEERRHVHLAYPEVSEFMVRRLDGQTLPVSATPGSGVIFDGLKDQWVPEENEIDHDKLNEIYRHCVEAQAALVKTANKLCEKRKIPLLDIATSQSWTDVEESVASACNTLEQLAEKDKSVAPGFTGKMKKAFRRLSKSAGVGSTIAELMPTDSYGAVLCGGLKVIFTALKQTGLYRQEIYRALEDIPSILSDNAAVLNLHHRDEELHRRAASLYASLFQLMEIILSWYLKNSFVTGAKILANASGFSDRLKDALAEVRMDAQRFGSHRATLEAKVQRNILQQNYSMMYLQGQGMNMQAQHRAEIRGDLADLRMQLGNIEELASKLAVLDNLKLLLGNSQDTLQRKQEKGHDRLLAHQSRLRLLGPVPTVEEILERNLYNPLLVISDFKTILQMQDRPGLDIDEDRVLAIQSHSRFNAWLTLNESSILLINANSDSASKTEMSIVSAKTFQRALDVSQEQIENESPVTVVPLAFFCCQHRDYQGDENGTPAELVMSLLLQLLDRYRNFSPEDLVILERLRPGDIHSICDALDALLSRMPASAIVIFIIDGPTYFEQPASRRKDMIRVVERLADIHRREYTVTVKLLLANPTQTDSVNNLLYEDEVLTIPRILVGGGGYLTTAWRNPVRLESPGPSREDDNDEYSN